MLRLARPMACAFRVEGFSFVDQSFNCVAIKWGVIGPLVFMCSCLRERSSVSVVLTLISSLSWAACCLLVPAGCFPLSETCCFLWLLAVV